MFLLPTAAEFKEWQILNYQQLLSEATTAKAIKFLSDNLTNLLSC